MREVQKSIKKYEKKMILLKKETTPGRQTNNQSTKKQTKQDKHFFKKINVHITQRKFKRKRQRYRTIQLSDLCYKLCP